MPAADSINGRITRDDRDLMRRISIALALLFAIVAGFSRLHDAYSQKFHEVTGEARWIWARHRMSDNLPLAFFATRDIDLPERRRYAHLKVLGDPEYTLFVNGREIAGRQVGEERQIDFYDISPRVKTGRNRVVIAVRATQGFGGLIASLDIGPETENWIVTDERWKIYRRWRPELLRHDPPGVAWEQPVIVGEPPIGRWNFLGAEPRPFNPPPTEVQPPKESFPLRAFLPTIKTRSGVAVAVAEPMRAVAYDFGFTSGRLRLTMARNTSYTSRAVKVRFANLREELETIQWDVRSVVFAPGETVVVTPESRDFRYVLVYGTQVTAEVVR
jgi:hypothetical protein